MSEKRILCFGDSNTWGAVPGEGIRYPQDVRWTGILQNELNDCRIIEEGYNGRTIAFEDPIEGRMSGIRYFSQCMDSQSPIDLLILMLGTNDMKARFHSGPETIAYGWGRYYDAIKIAPMAGERPKVLLVSPILIDPSYKDDVLFHDMFGEDAVERSEKMALAYEAAAKQYGWSYLNAADYGKASPVDGVHMDPTSHKNLGLALAKKIREIL